MMWQMRYEDGEVRRLNNAEARTVIRELFLDEDDRPRPMTDGFNELAVGVALGRTD